MHFCLNIHMDSMPWLECNKAAVVAKAPAPPPKPPVKVNQGVKKSSKEEGG
jgi:hypothetical protein